MANGKICISCYCIIPNASLQCYHCGNMQLNFYNKQERKSITAKCINCGKFIGNKQIENKEAVFKHLPLSELGPEENYWVHKKCF